MFPNVLALALGIFGMRLKIINTLVFPNAFALALEIFGMR